MRWLPLSTLILCVSCNTPTTYQVFHDSPDYVEHVIEDVTAMLEGMAAARSADRVVLRDPSFRSSRQPKVD